jgi:hypothetical protein
MTLPAINTAKLPEENEALLAAMTLPIIIMTSEYMINFLRPYRSDKIPTAGIHNAAGIENALSIKLV